MMVQYILLTGATGYLGQHILNHYLSLSADATGKQHYQVYALCRSKANQQQLRDAIQERCSSRASTPAACIHVIALDLSDAATVEAWLDGKWSPSSPLPLSPPPRFDVCIHTAALANPRLCQVDPVTASAINCPKAFFEVLFGKHSPSARMIALSTDQVYVGKPDQAPYTETDPTDPCNVYGQTKCDMENYLLRNYGQQSIFLLRSSIIVGPKAPLVANIAHDTFLHFVASRDGQTTVFYLDEKRSVIAVDDVVAIIIQLADLPTEITSAPITGVFNMGGPASVSRMDMAEAVFAHLEYDKQWLEPALKANEQASAPVPSPLDISMKSSKLQILTGISCRGLIEMVQKTFSVSP